jgi:DNA-binding transcriptional MocR family regulator
VLAKPALSGGLIALTGEWFPRTLALLTLPGRGELLPQIESWATDHGVLVGAGTFFGVPNGFRLSWASLPRDRFEEGLARLAPLLDR